MSMSPAKVLAPLLILAVLALGALTFIARNSNTGISSVVQAAITATCDPEMRYYDATVVDTRTSSSPNRVEEWEFQYDGGDFYAFTQYDDGKLEWLQRGTDFYWRFGDEEWQQSTGQAGYIGMCEPQGDDNDATRSTHDYTRGNREYRLVGPETLDGNGQAILN